MQKLPATNDPIWQKWARHDGILKHMLENHRPLTRDQWLKQAFLMDGVPDEIPAHLEDKMPPPFREKRWGEDDDED